MWNLLNSIIGCFLSNNVELDRSRNCGKRVCTYRWHWFLFETSWKNRIEKLFYLFFVLSDILLVYWYRSISYVLFIENLLSFELSSFKMHVKGIWLFSIFFTCYRKREIELIVFYLFMNEMETVFLQTSMINYKYIFL